MAKAAPSALLRITLDGSQHHARSPLTRFVSALRLPRERLRSSPDRHGQLAWLARLWRDGFCQRHVAADPAGRVGGRRLRSSSRAASSRRSRACNRRARSRSTRKPGGFTSPITAAIPSRSSATDGWKVIDSIALSGSPDALLLDGRQVVSGPMPTLGRYRSSTCGPSRMLLRLILVECRAAWRLAITG